MEEKGQRDREHFGVSVKVQRDQVHGASAELCEGTGWR